MRKLFTLVALLIGGIMAYATPDALQIELNTGEPVVFHLSHSPEVSFVGDIVKIKSSQPLQSLLSASCLRRAWLVYIQLTGVVWLRRL